MAVRSLHDRPIRARPAPRARGHLCLAHLLDGLVDHGFFLHEGSAGEAEKPSRALRRLHVGFPGQLVEGEERERSSAGLEAGELVGEVVQYKDIYRLCYIRGPEGIVVALAEELG